MKGKKEKKVRTSGIERAIYVIAVAFVLLCILLGSVSSDSGTPRWIKLYDIIFH